MADPMGLDVQGFKVGTRTQADPQTGKMQKVYTVSYSIGAHGPFEDVYTPAAYTTDAVKAGIAKHVAQLRALTTHISTGGANG